MIATCPEHELLREYARGLVSESQADELTNIPWTKPEDFSLQELESSGLLDNDSILVSKADVSIEVFRPVSAERIAAAVIINEGNK